MPDTVKVMPANNYTYPKVEYHGTAPLVATNEIANETIYPEISVPVDSSPSYHLYNKTVTSEGLLPVVQATSGSEVGVYDSSTPLEVLPVQTSGTLEPTSGPLVVMNANELPVVPLEEMDILEITETPDFVVEIPSQVQPLENNGVENIKISFIDKSKPVQAVNEVSLSPSPEGNLENIKISFLGNKTSPAVSAAGNVISLQPTVAEREHQSIRISFENEKENVAPTSAPLVHETANHITVQNLTVSLPSSVEHVLATPAPPMPTGPGVVNPFEGGIVDQIIRNATAVPMPSIEHVLATPAPPMPRGPGVVNPFEGGVVDVPAVPLSPNQNITVDFRHNTETGVPVVQQPHVTMQQHRK